MYRCIHVHVYIHIYYNLKIINILMIVTILRNTLLLILCYNIIFYITNIQLRLLNM